MSCKYGQPCANNIDITGAWSKTAAVGECVFCERDRLKAELADLKSHCPSCGCVVDSMGRGHHSVADCVFMRLVQSELDTEHKEVFSKC